MSFGKDPENKPVTTYFRAQFELEDVQAREIAMGVGRTVSGWRSVAARLGLATSEIDRMATAFEHDDLKAALAL